jgi:integrase
VRSQRERVAAPAEVSPLLAALEAVDRAIFATALYAGLRLGELQALQWDDVDLNTLDRYGHLLPGNETEAAHLLDTWLKNATTAIPT